jgi:hypothetical protein
VGTKEWAKHRNLIATLRLLLKNSLLNRAVLSGNERMLKTTERFTLEKEVMFSGRVTGRYLTIGTIWDPT